MVFYGILISCYSYTVRYPCYKNHSPQSQGMDMGLIHGIESHRETGHYPTSVHAQNAIWLQAAPGHELRGSLRA